ncbi:hypothetical protein GQ55_5G236900 [Panicum hallii var. hallii]|uniref:Uncharacterized protein n=1 Tax=Panicum hallii var. hallii TaxID=1504633 RepID=A0A2T7DJJ3_9POAL|nr:hypothetical protein GQ55_5G236900 [Panicum hallii var. hallii]
MATPLAGGALNLRDGHGRSSRPAPRPVAFTGRPASRRPAPPLPLAGGHHPRIRVRENWKRRGPAGLPSAPKESPHLRAALYKSAAARAPAALQLLPPGASRPGNLSVSVREERVQYRPADKLILPSPVDEGEYR